MENYNNENLRELPLLPLRGVLVFPYMVIHLDVGREKSINAIDTAMLGDREIFLAMQKDAQTDEPELEDIYQVGTIAEIKQLLKLPGGTIRVLVEGIKRAKIKNYLHLDPFFKVEVIPEEIEEEENNLNDEALMRTLIDDFEKYVKVSKRISPESVVSVISIEEPHKLADVIAGHLNLKLQEKQQLLEASNLEKRIEFLLGIIAKELEILELERKISARVRKQMEKTQREYYLREQLKAIKKELGDKDDLDAEVEELREKVEKLKLPKEIKEKALKEISRLEKMPAMVAEATVVRNYLDWLLNLPWNKQTKDSLIIKDAEDILEEDHYGLKEVKERILEFLAIRKLNPKMKSPILCFVGPPGVGKTSLGKSIARALGRKLIRVSLGGVRDESEIRGHRRTYVGSMPGRIIQSIKQAETKNPILLLDEIDKLGADYKGDPSSALLEVLDPEQNVNFVDHYMEVPFDLSKVLFITTANVYYTIPRPLLDRMEVIHISSYTEEEKLQIALRHLIPKQLVEHGLAEEKLLISENAVRRIIREYTKEAGVRSLQRQIAKVCRKIALEIVAGKAETGKVTAQNIEHYLGIPRYRYGNAEDKSQIGVVTGLAVTEVGGDVLSVEAIALKGKGNLTLTGKLGDVMKESAYAGFNYIKSKATELGIAEDFYDNYDVHIHVPEGAIPKDGPSAGITMGTAVASLLSNRKVKSNIAMTGEITLRGRVLAVGGIKEKVLAAHRAGAKTIILPKENEKNLEDIPVKVKRKLKIILVEHLEEVLNIALEEAQVKNENK